MTTLATLVVSLIGDVGGFVGSMKDAEKQAESTGSRLSSVFDGAGRAIGGMAKIAAGAAVAGVGVLTSAAIGGITAVNSWAGELDSLSDVLGTSADDSATLAVAIKGVGGDVGAITGQMARLTGGLRDAKGQLGPTGKVMRDLGIDFEDANGKMLDAPTILARIGSKLSEMPDGLEKTSIMIDLFGKSGKDLTDVLDALANDGLDAAHTKAREFGLLIGEEGVNNSIAFNKQMADLGMMVQGLFVQIGSFLLPIVIPLLQKFGEGAQVVIPMLVEGFKSIVTWIQTNLGPAFQQIIGILQTVVGWVQANWPQISAQISSAFETARAAVEPIITAISTFIQTVFGAIATFLATHGEEIRSFLQGAWNGIREIIDGVANIVRTVVTAVFGGIASFTREHGAEIQRILEGAWNAIRNAVETVINTVKGIINTVLAVLKGDWQGAWDSIKLTVETIWGGIKTAVETAINTVKTVLETAWGAIKGKVEEAWNGIGAIVQGAIHGVIQFLGTLPGEFLRIGGEIISGLWNGIRNMFEQIVRGIGDFFQGIVNEIKRILGIGSPSRVFADMGQQMMTGLAMGITQGANLPQLALNAAVGNVTANVGLLGTGQGGDQFNFGDIILPTPTNASPQMISQAILDEAARRADDARRMK